MSYLTVRAEQALLGAMLSDRPLPPELDLLRPEDLSHRVHRQLFTAIVELREKDSPVAGDRLTAEVAQQVSVPGVEASWLAELRDTCPEPAHIAAYARMIQVAAFRRDVAAHGERIAASATTGRANGDTALHMTKLAQALTRQAEVFAAYTAVDEAESFRVSVSVSASAGVPDARTEIEDQILADLLQNPEQARDLARLLPSDIFTSDQRREIFETMVMLAEAGDPIDEIIVLWTLENQRGIAAMFGDRPQWTEHVPEPDAAYLARLASTTTTSGTAAQLARELMAGDIRHQLTQTTSEVARQHGRPHTQVDPTLIPPPPSVQPDTNPRLGL